MPSVHVIVRERGWRYKMVTSVKVEEVDNAGNHETNKLFLVPMGMI